MPRILSTLLPMTTAQALTFLLVLKDSQLTQASYDNQD